MSEYSYGSWPLDHPVLGSLLLILGSGLGAALGVGAVVVATAHHLIAPGNMLAGAGMGIGGVVLGCVAALGVMAAMGD